MELEIWLTLGVLMLAQLVWGIGNLIIDLQSQKKMREINEKDIFSL